MNAKAKEDKLAEAETEIETAADEQEVRISEVKLMMVAKDNMSSCSCLCLLKKVVRS